MALAVGWLERLGMARAQVALVLLEAQLLAAPAPMVPGVEGIESGGALRPHALLWGLTALGAGEDPRLWMRFAATLAEPVALFEGLLDLVGEVPAEVAPRPRLGALVRACLADHAALAVLLEGFAGDWGRPERLEGFRLAVAHGAVLRQLVARREALLSLARAALPVDRGAPGEAFLAALTEGFRHLEGALWARALVARAQCAPPAEATDVATSVRAAVAHLEDTSPWRSSWDVQRFHPMGAPNILVARSFAEGMILLALSEVGGDRQLEIEALLERVPDGDVRYFPEWRGLPPDADSLGLLLQLAARLGTPPRARIAGWLAVLEASLGGDGIDGIVPAWLERGPRGRTATLEGPFLGNDCTAVRLAFLLGAILYDAERFAPLVRPNLGAVLAQYREGDFGGCVHYAPEFAAHLFLRLAHELSSQASPALRELARELGVLRVVADLSATMVAAQRLDGGWGSPQRTALMLEGLAISGAAPERLRRAVKYLVETQGPDGAWPAEPLYITPGKLGGMVPLAGKELTTALCVRALHRAG